MSQIGTSEADRMAQAVEARIKAIAQQVYKEVPSDRELEGLVISKDSQNKYTVKINNATYKNIMQERSLGEIKPNTIVKVKVPNNQMNNAYICGVVDGTITTYSNGGGGGGTAVNVVDRLDSTSTTEALSANQGRILNDKIENNISNIEELSLDFNSSTINGKFIKDNPVLTAADVGALPSTTVIPEGVKLYTELGQNTDGAVTQKTVTDELNNKVDIVEGKELSTNDFTNEDKSKLESLSNYDDTELANRVTQNETNIRNLQTSKADKTEIPNKVSQLENDEGYLTSYTETDPTVPSYVKNITETNISDWNNKLSSVPSATSTTLGGVYGSTEESPNGATTLGYNARSTSRYAVAIGAGSSVDAQGAIQIGAGSNTIPNTATFGSSNSPVNSLALYTTRNGVAGYHTVAFEEDLNNSGSGGTSAGLPIGFVIYSSCKQNNAGLHLADGSELAIGGTYDAFCQYIINNLDDFPICSIGEYYDDIDNYGQCGRYVVNNTASDITGQTEKGIEYTIPAYTIKIPKITKGIESANSESEFGTSLGAGLPNITGQIYSQYFKSPVDKDYWSGALSLSTEISTTPGSGSSKGFSKINFDASKSNSIYGKSNTVQPQTTKYYCYIVIGTVTKTDIEVNIDNITADLNNITNTLEGKANKEVIETIWTNSNATSSQATQTITATKDLTQYKAFILNFNRETNNTTNYTVTQYKGSNSDLINTNFIGLWGYTAYQRNVNIKVASNNIEIGACYKQTSFGGGSQDNSKNILTSIRGVK